MAIVWQVGPKAGQVSCTSTGEHLGGFCTFAI